MADCVQAGVTDAHPSVVTSNEQFIAGGAAAAGQSACSGWGLRLDLRGIAVSSHCGARILLLL